MAGISHYSVLLFYYFFGSAVIVQCQEYVRIPVLGIILFTVVLSDSHFE